MTINVDLTKFSEKELIELNHQIIERLKFLQQTRCFQDIAKFNIGELVSFKAEGGRTVVGIVTKLNQKTVTIASEDGMKWRVSAALLSKTSEAIAKSELSKEMDQLTNVISLHRKQKNKRKR